MIKDVFVIFKTHLDIGYTDYAKNVVNTYVNTFLPNAIKTGYELKDTDTPFIWTVGSWLIWEGLKKDKDGSLEQAIRDGIISWHALPFTSHTELMNKELFEYGLSISKKLDERFNVKTIGSKMTDVPGHTIGMIPSMKKYGIEFMHIGVNEATPLPNVPPLFKWKCDNDEIIVMYEKGYGTDMEIEDFAVCFGHTFDNRGAQSVDSVKKLYSELQKKYPGAKIKAATLNDVAERMLKLEKLPIVDCEIGDTWIHGAGTDPKKLGMYRELLRYVEDKKIDIDKVDLSDNLLLVPEHTWGMCVNRYFHNPEDWYAEDFEKTNGTDARTTIEKSWREQREYIELSEKSLNKSVSYDVKEPVLDGYEIIDAPNCDFELSWQIFDVYDYDRYLHKYMTLTPMNISWASWDYLKLGLPIYSGGIYNADVKLCYKKGNSVLYKLDFDKGLSAEYGLPYIWAEKRGNHFEFKWFGKKASRIPQACWLKFKNFDENWEINKMDRWIDPHKILGSPLISAVDKGIRNADYEIVSYDAALVAPFGRRLLDYNLNPENEDMYFNLYNNIWNTNFPMWYDDNSMFRFDINKR